MCRVKVESKKSSRVSSRDAERGKVQFEAPGEKSKGLPEKVQKKKLKVRWVDPFPAG